MREILFRGRSMAQGSDWLYGDVLLYENSAQIWETINGRKHNSVVSIKTVGQFTGLKDKKGNKIFEGDIVTHFINWLGKRVCGVVNYDCKIASWVVDFTEKENKESDFLANWVSGNACEVIGNIHDNPELLNKEANEND